VEAELFLRRIAARLGRPPSEPVPAPPGGPPASYLARPLGDGTAERTARFAEELELIGAKLIRSVSREETEHALADEIRAFKAERLVSFALEEFEAWGLADFLVRLRCRAFDATEKPSGFWRACEQADLGITTVDFAIVNTGTLAIAANARRPRAVSLLPTVHVALVRESQLVDRLGQAFAAYEMRHGLGASNIHFITGPSRTSDIENDLTIGVHGPAAVSVILWQDAPALAEGCR
jgi:L-lactate dehydrogenase complex protein LldG